jgi:hypothetical protein
MKDGSPFKEPEAMTEMLKNSEELVADSIVKHLRCSFCWQGTPMPKVSNHKARDCPLLKKFNTKHASKNLCPVSLNHNSIKVDATREPLSVEEVDEKLAKVKADLTETLAELDRQLKAVEQAPKCKADEPTDPHPPKQKKGSANDMIDRMDAVPPKKGKKKGKKVEDATPALSDLRLGLGLCTGH